MTLVLRSGWAAAPFMKGYGPVISLTDDKRDRLPELLLSRQVIEPVFRACRDPKTGEPVVAQRRSGVGVPRVTRGNLGTCPSPLTLASMSWWSGRAQRPGPPASYPSLNQLHSP
ncbi:MAG: hypothetical protein ACRDYB_05875 [Acidimicrobiales bacterium]